MRAGFVSAVIFGLLALFIDVTFLGASSVIATPMQVILEYPIAFGVLGLTGLFRKKSATLAVVGVGFSVFIKFLIHYFVGVYVWVNVYQFPPEWGQYLWPAIYNGSFLLVEFIISAVLIFALVKKRTLEYGL
jgi:thiamine transporter